MTAFKYLAAALVSFLGLFVPVKAMVIAAAALCAVDFFTGIIAAWKRKEPITSSKMRRTVVKALIYEAAIVSAFTVQHWMAADALPIVSWISGIIGLVELKSVIENLNSISGENLLKQVIDKLTNEQSKQAP